MAEGTTRREALKYIASLAAGIAVGAAGYHVARPAPPPTTPTPTKEVTKTVTTTVTTTVAPPTPAKKVKAGWIYVGPVGDYGWSYAHDQGRLHVEKKFPWLETMKAEKVSETEVAGVIDSMVAEGAEVIFTTSFGFMDPTIDAAKKYPDVVFEHCSGYKRARNVGTYFAEFYQLYYLNGLAAGAVTRTEKVGYVAAHFIPEVIRHMNAFVLGAREAGAMLGKDVRAFVVKIGDWYNPTKAREAAETLVETHDVDVIAFTEDTPTVLQVAEEYQEKGKKVWSFSHYSDMRKYGPTAHLTGQIVDWGLMYEYILAKYYSGAWTSEDLWWRIGDGLPVRWAKPVEASTAGQREGAVYLAPLNPVIPDNVVTLIKRRYEEMKELLFEPFTGPIYDNEGTLRVEKGRRLGHEELWSMEWFVEGIEIVPI